METKCSYAANVCAHFRIDPETGDDVSYVTQWTPPPRTEMQQNVAEGANLLGLAFVAWVIWAMFIRRGPPSKGPPPSSPLS